MRDKYARKRALLLTKFWDWAWHFRKVEGHTGSPTGVSTRAKSVPIASTQVCPSGRVKITVHVPVSVLA